MDLQVWMRPVDLDAVSGGHRGQRPVDQDVATGVEAEGAEVDALRCGGRLAHVLVALRVGIRRR